MRRRLLSGQLRLLRGAEMSRGMVNRKSFLIAMVVSALVGTAIVLSLKPENPKIWAAVMILLAGGGVATISYVFRRRAARVLHGREALQDKDIYSRFYADSGLPASTVAELWHEVADALRLPYDKLRPADRFGQELGGGYLLTSEELDVLAAMARDRASKRQTTVDLSTLKTLDDYIRSFAALEPRGEPHGPGSN